MHTVSMLNSDIQITLYQEYTTPYMICVGMHLSYKWIFKAEGNYYYLFTSKMSRLDSHHLRNCALEVCNTYSQLFSSQKQAIAQDIINTILKT